LRAIAASVPFKWVAGDTVYDVGDIEQQLVELDATVVDKAWQALPARQGVADCFGKFSFLTDGTNCFPQPRLKSVDELIESSFARYSCRHFFPTTIAFEWVPCDNIIVGLRTTPVLLSIGNDRCGDEIFAE
jgi:hypothetical protein